MTFYGDKVEIARFVLDLVVNLGISSASIMITLPAMSEGCSVHIAIDTSLEDIVKTKALNYSLVHTNISPGNTPAGLPLPE